MKLLLNFTTVLCNTVGGHSVQELHWNTIKCRRIYSVYSLVNDVFITGCVLPNLLYMIWTHTVLNVRCWITTPRYITHTHQVILSKEHNVFSYLVLLKSDFITNMRYIIMMYELLSIPLHSCAQMLHNSHNVLETYAFFMIYCMLHPTICVVTEVHSVVKL